MRRDPAAGIRGPWPAGGAALVRCQIPRLATAPYCTRRRVGAYLPVVRPRLRRMRQARLSISDRFASRRVVTAERAPNSVAAPGACPKRNARTRTSRVGHANGVRLAPHLDGADAHSTPGHTYPLYPNGRRG